MGLEYCADAQTDQFGNVAGLKCAGNLGEERRCSAEYFGLRLFCLTLTGERFAGKSKFGATGYELMHIFE
jgi:hypothetical protein